MEHRVLKELKEENKSERKGGGGGAHLREREQVLCCSAGPLKGPFQRTPSTGLLEREQALCCSAGPLNGPFQRTPSTDLFEREQALVDLPALHLRRLVGGVVVHAALGPGQVNERELAVLFGSVLGPRHLCCFASAAGPEVRTKAWTRDRVRATEPGSGPAKGGGGEELEKSKNKDDIECFMRGNRCRGAPQMSRARTRVQGQHKSQNKGPGPAQEPEQGSRASTRARTRVQGQHKNQNKGPGPEQGPRAEQGTEQELEQGPRARTRAQGQNKSRGPEQEQRARTRGQGQNKGRARRRRRAAWDLEDVALAPVACVARASRPSLEALQRDTAGPLVT